MILKLVGSVQVTPEAGLIRLRGRDAGVRRESEGFAPPNI